MEHMALRAIGLARANGESFSVVVENTFAPALLGLDGFSHALIVWWASGCDRPRDRERLVLDRPYAGGPDELGVFATRSPARPNPIGISVVGIRSIDAAAGTLNLDGFDLADGTPVLDIKPYHPSADRSRRATVPAWCANWPTCLEEAAAFDWAAVFPND